MVLTVLTWSLFFSSAFPSSHFSSHACFYADASFVSCFVFLLFFCEFFFSLRSLSVSVRLHKDLTLLHSCTILSLVTELLCALDHSSNAFALAQGCNKTELHFHRSRVSDVAAADQDRRCHSLCSESVTKCTQQSMADWMQSAASPVPCRGSQQVLQKQPSRTESATVFRRAGTAAMTKASSGTSWQSCTCGCKHGQTRVSESW